MAARTQVLSGGLARRTEPRQIRGGSSQTPTQKSKLQRVSQKRVALNQILADF